MTKAARQILTLMKRHNRRCAYCDRQVSTLLPADHPLRATRDHVVPKSRGGDGRLSNLVLACRACNCARGNQVPTVETKPTAARIRAARAALLLGGAA